MNTILLRKGVKTMEKIVKFKTKEEQKRWNEVRENYKKDFRSYVLKREAEDNTIHFRSFDNREQM